MMKAGIAGTKNFLEQLIPDLTTGELEHYTALSDNNDVFDLPFKDLFDVVDGHLIVLYKKTDRGLSLVVADFVFSMKDDFLIAYCIDGADGFLKIRDSGQSISLVFFDDHKPVSSIFYAEEDEDANFVLWLFNVLNSDKRRKIVLNAW